MGSTIKKWIFLITMISIFMLIQAQQQVPCLFFFGDSLFDNGNNNNLATLVKVNYKPYGIDYPDGSTGRFSNGQNIADFLARFLGFLDPIPPYATTKGSNILGGLNYASGSAGILEESGSQLGYRFSMNRQLQFHQQTTRNIGRIFRNQTATVDYLRKCLYVVNIGNNDYINNYYLPNSLSRVKNTPQRFAKLLVQKYSKQLRILYNAGSRKIAVFGLGSIGCIPLEVAQYPPTNGSPCVDFINVAVRLFNDRLLALIAKLNRRLPDARFTFTNVTDILLGDPSDIASLSGITVVNAPCCKVMNLTGQCVPNQTPCSIRNQYAFWDNLHPTEALNGITATGAYTAFRPSNSFPVDIRTLVQQ